MSALVFRVFLLALAAVVAAFGTINEPRFLQQHNEHEMITRLALQCPSGQGSDGFCFEPRSLDQLAGHHLIVMGIAIPGFGSNGAVGAPDTFDILPEGPEAHCDDADFLDVPGYPQNRTQANAKLQACVDHLRRRFRQAVAAVDRLLDERNRVRPDMVRILFAGDCTFAFPGLQHDELGRAKCAAIEGLGRALHGIQDFYSHSNWVDSHDPRHPISISNPPGLGMNGTAPFLDLRANSPISADLIPRNLTTGCFALPDSLAGSGECEGRITHHALSKDRGLIFLDGTFGEVEFDPRSEAISSNFHFAVQAAVQHTRETWADLQNEIRHRYGPVVGDLMICSLVRDDPVKTCRNRTLTIAIDTSLESEIIGGIRVEELIAQEIDSRLSTEGQDRLAILDSHAEMALRYPMGLPSHATFDFSQPSGELCIACGLESGIAETINAQPETYTDRGAILLLTTGAESPELGVRTLTQLDRAVDEGIRVHHACISMEEQTHDGGGQTRPGWERCSADDPLVPAVLKTGGVVAFLDGHRARVPAQFSNLVMDRGLTATDDDGAAEHTRLYPGITLADFLSPAHPTKSFTYPVSAGERLNFTVNSVALDGRGAEECFTVTLWYKFEDVMIEMQPRCGDSAPLSLVYDATEPFDLVLEAEFEAAASPLNAFLRQEQEILFLVGVDTSMPDKDEQTIRTATRVLSSSTTVDIPGVTAARGILTSETVEVLTCTATVNGSTATATGSVKVDDERVAAAKGAAAKGSRNDEGSRAVVGDWSSFSSSPDQLTLDPFPTCSAVRFAATTGAGNSTCDRRGGLTKAPVVATAG
ncbi:hypothetical protein NEMBOFW57_006709 [Staphylotrichum longicolle]|uniref:Uncharacterized protein n=1 Tax=Staphylotrichum longicolle TaxID=669026 RepID=A0AAD4ETD9_9PEZI|nr:hypothetical protein NEMBOFW57_006709 [Staphylotrichum longicolle]